MSCKTSCFEDFKSSKLLALPATNIHSVPRRNKERMHK